ncbi:hypothetical protein FOA52_012948 [Chlamydomonas sp. UWO 241]|nr:hypothetical protein FOA52_012948 [Chlamydomonas sp. UWO 241]
MGKGSNRKGKPLKHRAGPKPPAMKHTPASSTTGGKQTASSKTRTKAVEPSPVTAVEAVPSASPPWDSLPSEVLAACFSTLRAGDVGAAACVCTAWRDAADGEPQAWATALTELDPFCSLGGHEGALKLAKSAGGWLRAAAALTGTTRPCDKCGCGRTAKCWCSSKCPEVLCGCPARTRSDVHRRALPGCGGMLKRCTVHCGHSAACVPLRGRLLNRWMMHPRHMMGAYGLDAPAEEVTLVGDGTSESGQKLQAAVCQAACLSTITIRGTFTYGPDDDALHIHRPVRIVGDGYAAIRTSSRPVFALAEVVVLEGVHIIMLDEDENACDCCCSMCCNCDFEPTYSPALQVERGCHLIAHKVVANSELGTAIMVDDGGSAYLRECTVSSRGPHSNNCLGVVLKNDAMLAMYDTVIKDSMWGVYAGPGGDVLRGANTFINIEYDHVTHMYKEYERQTVNPWRAGFTYVRTYARASGAS